MKCRGFDLEATHLQGNDKLKKLIAMVSIAYSLCASLGIFYHQKVKSIGVKNHGYKAVSVVPKGIDLVQKWFRGKSRLSEQIYQRWLSFVRYLEMNIAYHQLLKIVG